MTLDRKINHSNEICVFKLVKHEVLHTILGLFFQRLKICGDSVSSVRDCSGLRPLMSGRACAASLWTASVANRARVQPSARHLSRRHWVERTLRLDCRAKPHGVRSWYSAWGLCALLNVYTTIKRKWTEEWIKRSYLFLSSRRKIWWKYGGAKHFYITILVTHDVETYSQPSASILFSQSNHTTVQNHWFWASLG